MPRSPTGISDPFAPDEESKASPGLFEVGGEFRATWDPGTVRIGLELNRCPCRRSISITKRTQKRRIVTVSTIEKSVARMPLAWVPGTRPR